MTVTTNQIRTHSASRPPCGTYPIQADVDGTNDEDFLEVEKLFVGEDGVDERDDLKRLSQTHAMRQDCAAAAVALLHALYALHHAVVHELDAFHLMRLQMLADAAVGSETREIR